MDRIQQQSESPTPGSKSLTVLSIECLKGSSKSNEWTDGKLQTGDIVEEIRIGSGANLRSGLSRSYKSPFKNWKNGVQKILHSSFKNKETSILARIGRGRVEFVELQACIVPQSGLKKNYYMLRSIADPSYAVGFTDRTEFECFEFQGTPGLSTHYPGLDYKMVMCDILGKRESKNYYQFPTQIAFFPLLLLPKALDLVASRYNDVEDTLARANAWLTLSQASGVPIVLLNIQTESLLTKVSGETASAAVNAGSLSDLSNLANASLYGFEDYHGVDLGVVKAVRIWYAPIIGEFAIEIKIKEGDLKLGFAISRTEEGFISISSVIDGDENAPSTGSELNLLNKEATSASKLLVVSRVPNQKVLPWMVSSTGAIRCFDTVSLSQKLSFHRHAKLPILLQVFLWDQALVSMFRNISRTRTVSPPAMPMPPEVRLALQCNDNLIQPFAAEVPNGSRIREGTEPRLERDTAGEVSFRFHDFSLIGNWL